MRTNTAISTQKYNYEKQGQKTLVRASNSNCKDSMPVGAVLRGCSGRSLGSRAILSMSRCQGTNRHDVHCRTGLVPATVVTTAFPHVLIICGLTKHFFVL